MVSVSDVAEALLRACTDDSFKGRSFNVTPNAQYTYESFTGILKKACGCDFEVIKITPEEAVAGQVPFPYPISKAESESYDGSALAETGFEYTDIIEGLKEAWEFYVHSR